MRRRKRKNNERKQKGIFKSKAALPGDGVCKEEEEEGFCRIYPLTLEIQQLPSPTAVRRENIEVKRKEPSKHTSWSREAIQSHRRENRAVRNTPNIVKLSDQGQHF